MAVTTTFRTSSPEEGHAADVAISCTPAGFGLSVRAEAVIVYARQSSTGAVFSD
jgi:hypothetical protein